MPPVASREIPKSGLEALRSAKESAIKDIDKALLVYRFALQNENGRLSLTDEFPKMDKDQLNKLREEVQRYIKPFIEAYAGAGVQDDIQLHQLGFPRNGEKAPVDEIISGMGLEVQLSNWAKPGASGGGDMVSHVRTKDSAVISVTDAISQGIDHNLAMIAKRTTLLNVMMLLGYPLNIAETLCDSLYLVPRVGEASDPNSQDVIFGTRVTAQIKTPILGDPGRIDLTGHGDGIGIVLRPDGITIASGQKTKDGQSALSKDVNLNGYGESDPAERSQKGIIKGENVIHYGRTHVLNDFPSFGLDKSKAPGPDTTTDERCSLSQKLTGGEIIILASDGITHPLVKEKAWRVIQLAAEAFLQAGGDREKERIVYTELAEKLKAISYESGDDCGLAVTYVEYPGSEDETIVPDFFEGDGGSPIPDGVLATATGYGRDMFGPDGSRIGRERNEVPSPTPVGRPPASMSSGANQNLLGRIMKAFERTSASPPPVRG